MRQRDKGHKAGLMPLVTPSSGALVSCPARVSAALAEVAPGVHRARSKYVGRADAIYDYSSGEPQQIPNPYHTEANIKRDFKRSSVDSVRCVSLLYACYYKAS